MNNNLNNNSNKIKPTGAPIAPLAGNVQKPGVPKPDGAPKNPADFLEIKYNLSEEMVAYESVLSSLVERQHSQPSDINLESMFNGLRDGSVYVPVKVVLTPQDQIKLQDNVRNKRNPMEGINVRMSPQIVANKVGQKAMLWFSRLEEIPEDKKKGFQFAKLPVGQLISICENIPDAFDIVFDLYSHQVKLSLDEVILGIDPHHYDDLEGFEG